MSSLLRCTAWVPLALVLLAGCVASGLTDDPDAVAFESSPPPDLERMFVGPEYWANRLHDWRIAAGRIEVVADDERNPMRALHLLTRRVGAGPGDVRLSVVTQPLADATDPEAVGGFVIGAGPGMDYRGAALVFGGWGPGAGYFAGVDADGALVIKNLNESFETVAEAPVGANGPVGLTLTAAPEEGSDMYGLELVATAPDGGDEIGRVALDGVPAGALAGNVALLGHRQQRAFEGWSVDGSRVEAYPERTAGPVIGALYTLDENVLKLSAQLMPIAEADAQTVRLEARRGGAWETVAEADVVMPGYVATFRVPGWDDTEAVPYRVAYDLITGAGGATTTHFYEGVVRRNPVDEDEEVVVAGFTGNHNVAHGFGREGYDYATKIWFPHRDIVEHVGAHDPDLLFFSGDQVYEGGSPTWADRSGDASSYYDLLYKWYLFEWAYQEITRDRPTVTIPDDHDVYQGNLWGQGGPAVEEDHDGGYIMPAEWVKMAERIQTSHLPDPYDPTPIEQGIGVYYTTLDWGRVGFAIIEDRKFKTGPEGLIPGHEGRPDHIQDPDFDPAIVDRPGLELLGDRQEAFLNDWATDWSGHDMKAVLSQTVFGGMATHHGADLFRLLADLDSNGWPMDGRRRALEAMRKGFAFHLAGDQHLSTIVHHGIDEHRDAGFAFVVPSIANFYPRAWMPEEEGANREPGMPPHLGDHYDGLRNPVTLYGATNPTSITGVSTGVEPLELHDRMPGYGIVRFNKADRTITMENWPRYSDPTDPDAEQYPGWPMTIDQQDNYAREAVAYLPTLEVLGLEDPVVQIEDGAGEVVYALRIDGATFRPKVFAPGAYTVRVSDGEGGPVRTLELQSLPPDETASVEVAF